jgi:hormone-sensitive lipase
MSSSSHENYLRKWTTSLGVPVISIDYRLAPENPYPKALDDVWQAYNWILNYAEEEFGIQINKIILAGDSAGGHLAFGLTYLLILHNKRLPDGLILSYPGKYK